jgi:glyceraldehyde-3-phosphate dehydrogenase/erythrose-4-phosphate dehydrogenase
MTTHIDINGFGRIGRAIDDVLHGRAKARIVLQP